MCLWFIVDDAPDWGAGLVRFLTGSGPNTVTGGRRMTVTPRFLARRRIFPLIVILAWLAGTAQRSIGQELTRANANAPIHIEVRDAQGSRVAGPADQAGSASGAELAFDRVYQPGDRILFGGPQRLALHVDDSMPDCLIYAPLGSSGAVSYEIPFGREEKQTGSAYAPESFAGGSHRISIRPLKKQEISEYRNLALNPCDLLRSDDSSVQFFPHASSNSVSRSLFDFEARNAIDGRIENGHHGVWPYQSWGPQLRTDIWWRVDFGRPVEVDKIRLMVRADFPHDSYWKSADVEFSDGSRVPLQISSSPEFQDYSFSRRRVTWLRITNVVPADPAKWCSFIEVEAWGKDLRK